MKRELVAAEDVQAVAGDWEQLQPDGWQPMDNDADGETTHVPMFKSIDSLPTIAECGAVAVSYIDEPVLPRAAVVGLTGDPECGKTTLAQALARNAHNSGNVRALFLDRENPLAVVADRLKRLGMVDGPGCRIWGGWLPLMAPMPDHPIVRAWVVENAAPNGCIVVVDSLSAFCDGDQNDATVVRALMHRCRRLADLGATVVVLHHSGKSETSKDYRGSSDFPAAVDCAWHLTSLPTDGLLDKLVLRAYKNRFGAARELAYSYAGGKMVRVDAGEVKATVSEQLMAIIRCEPGITSTRFQDVAAERKLGRDRARKFLHDGVLAGTIIRRPGSKKNEMRHYLPGTDGQPSLPSLVVIPVSAQNGASA
ncbi:MAG: AAA family ATPase [Bryobacteraceae bacterium]|jgi:KaiC/GvpD/RAD55 family RecA-like ATPase